MYAVCLLTRSLVAAGLLKEEEEEEEEEKQEQEEQEEEEKEEYNESASGEKSVKMFEKRCKYAYTAAVEVIIRLLISNMALRGVPFISRFYRKDLIIERVEMCFVTRLFVFVCLAERVTLLPFGALTFWQARKTMKMCDLSVEHLRETVIELIRKLLNQIVDRQKNSGFLYLSCTAHSLPAQQENSQRRFEWKRDPITSFLDHFVTRA
ncbi:hypothetical protein ALC53_08002 [Atta colombica]|uniref:Uncharacterized protein n=1 Tax=Atta colombica TaxID=520822 RepID=A0A195BBM9_9HYME|nr:hypothetical protein ALC53_08002 [Atta colombica]